MGRPSRKRPRPQPLAEVENSSLHHTLRAPVLAGACSNSNSSSSLRSLVNNGNSGSGSGGTGGGKQETADEATLTVQHVWGALSEADVAVASSSALSLGANIEIDRVGVAWLVNAPTRGEPRQRCGEHSSTVGALDSRVQDTASLPPQQPIPDGHAVAAAEEESCSVAPPSEHDSAKTAPPSSATFCACEVSLREQLSRAKEEFEDIPVAVFKRVRSACNPAEALGSGSFLNRSALKLANIDAIVEGLLAQGARRSRTEDGEKTEEPSAGGEGEASQPLHFVDLCGGPGGFSEYLLRRRRQLGLPARGWGISLRGDESGIAEKINNTHHGRPDRVEKNTEHDPCAWRLGHLRPWCDVSVLSAGIESAPTATEVTKKFSGKADAAKHAAGEAIDDFANGTAAAAADPSFVMRIDYGPKGTGDLTDEANMQGFVDTVLALGAGGRRPDLVVADGGFGAARDALAQEALVSPLVHCEAFAALLLLGEGGVFVCKLFECWTESTAALVYLMHRKFRQIAIVKPITSRPASGERYLVCTGLLPPGPSPPECRFTNALRAKVLALEETGRWRRRRNCSARPSSPTAAVSIDSWVGQASCSVSQEERGGGEVCRDGFRDNRATDVGRGGDDDAADGGGRLDAALGVEAEMKQDESFMSFLRLSNNTLASLQAKACAKIVDIASTRRGRAWAFQDSNSNRGVRGSGGSGSKNAVAMSGELLSNFEDAEENGDDAAALRCFSQAWGLDGI